MRFSVACHLDLSHEDHALTRFKHTSSSDSDQSRPLRLSQAAQGLLQRLVQKEDSHLAERSRQVSADVALSLVFA